MEDLYRSRRRLGRTDEQAAWKPHQTALGQIPSFLRLLEEEQNPQGSANRSTREQQIAMKGRRKEQGIEFRLRVLGCGRGGDDDKRRVANKQYITTTQRVQRVLLRRYSRINKQARWRCSGGWCSSVSRCEQGTRQGTWSGILGAILRMAWRVPSCVKEIHHCQVGATSSHNHYQHHVGHHPCQQENRISACLLHFLLDDG